MTAAVKVEGRPTWAEIRLSALQHNLRLIQRHVNPPGERKAARRKVLAVVKANAYGHGAVPVSKALAKAGADWFGVTCTAEGIELREAGIRQPILVLTGFWPGEEKRLLEYNLTPAITRCDQLRLLERTAARSKGNRNKPFGFHLKIDTGMNRLGIAPTDAACFARELAKCPHLRLEGTFTHLASSEVFTVQQTECQEKTFRGALEGLRGLGLDPGLVHMANSAGVATRPSSWADMVRPGAIIYGYHQFYEPPERTAEARASLPLIPALSVRARIISLRHIAAGQGVGYNAQFVAQSPTRIAVIPVGYADGLPRELGNRGRVLVRGQFAPLVGVISMDLAMVDVSGIEGVQVGDIVTLYGRDGQAAQYASDIARTLGTVTSAVLCALGKRIPRFYLP